MLINIYNMTVYMYANTTYGIQYTLWYMAYAYAGEE